ncbi:hypothetical protein MUK42_31465 [Musa troglodytarum]|uniref:Uncharacterized protein n=1 Tax=Musa troglodytarum TaxID=320322 RepID=A0A9E7L584_9LILI|nr:hypothetical protein MUK42_31465 [Musa troglodytarum]
MDGAAPAGLAAGGEGERGVRRSLTARGPDTPAGSGGAEGLKQAAAVGPLSDSGSPLVRRRRRFSVVGLN